MRRSMRLAREPTSRAQRGQLPPFLRPPALNGHFKRDLQSRLCANAG